MPVEPADEALLRDTFAGLDGSVGEVLERMQRTIPLLAGLTTVQLREFLRECRVHRQRPVGAEVLNRRQFGESLYAVLEGAVEVAVPREDGDFDPVYEHPDEGREWRYTLGAGDFFGELSLLSGRYVASAPKRPLESAICGGVRREPRLALRTAGTAAGATTSCGAPSTASSPLKRVLESKEPSKGDVHRS